MTQAPTMADKVLAFLRAEQACGRPFPSWTALVEALGMKDEAVKAQRFCKDTESDAPVVWHPRFEIAEILQGLVKMGFLEAYYVSERRIGWRMKP